MMEAKERRDGSAPRKRKRRREDVPDGAPKRRRRVRGGDGAPESARPTPREQGWEREAAEASARPRRVRRVPARESVQEQEGVPVERKRREPYLRAIVNRWWDRLTDVADKRSFSRGASEYAANQTKRDYVLNTVGLAAWGALFPVLSIIATQLAGAEQAGMFSMAFTTATLMLYVGNYGVRTYQVSDLDEADSFSSYQIHRVITCVAMLLVCALWCALRGYGSEMRLITWGAFCFRAVDALADTYEARLQQMGKLYLSGVSVAVRSIAGIVAFTALLFVTRSLIVASVGMAVAAAATLVVLTMPLAFLETPKSRSFDAVELRELFVECFPSFAAQFLFALIETMPKFAMEGALPYEDQVYFSAIYFPAQSILMIVGFVYKPQLVRIASVWADRAKRARFDLIVVAMLAVSVVVTIIMLLVFAWVGVWLNGVLYGIDFEPMRTAQYLMIVAGGFSAAIDFLYQTITVLRRQAQATVTYLAAFVLVAVASLALVRTVGFDGAVWSYLAVMVVLFIMLGVQFVLIRLRGAR